MSLSLKKPNYINTSDFCKEDINKTFETIKDENPKHPFIIFKTAFERSWKEKIKDLKDGDEFQKNISNFPNLNMNIDSIKNRSLITYMDAPWGSGKTYFIENLIHWIKYEDENKNEIKFRLGREEKEEEISINFLDAWEINNIESITDFLMQSFDINKKDFLLYVQENKLDLKEKFSKFSKTRNVLKILGAITIGLVRKTIGPDIVEELKAVELESIFSGLGDSFKDNDKTTILVSFYIEDKYKNNNNLVIIDNIERLESKKRLEIINTIMNWSCLGGSTYIFLTNFEKIRISKDYEEDFWNKISLHETFKLSNNWETYVKKYNRSIDLNKSENMDILEFIMILIPTFFKNNEDDMDIREIKKLLDNWIIEKDATPKDKISSFLKELVDRNLEGLDKYFLINYAITWLSDYKWDLWSGDESIKKLGAENVDNTPLINNKMFRIQSNFYDLEVEINKDDNINFKNLHLLKLKEKEIIHFKKFNNFIDDRSSKSFEKIIVELFQTRLITSKENFLYKYIIFQESQTNCKYIKYFEFKYNNIKKIHIYNDVFK